MVPDPVSVRKLYTIQSILLQVRNNLILIFNLYYMFYKIFKIFSVVLFLSVSTLILINSYKINLMEENELSMTEKYLKHMVNDHKVNGSVFTFPVFNFIYINYFNRSSAFEMNLAAAVSLILIPLTIIFYTGTAKLFCTDKILFMSGFNRSQFRPPRSYR